LDALACSCSEPRGVALRYQNWSYSEMLRIVFAAFAFPFPQTSGSTPGLSNPESEAVLSLPKSNSYQSGNDVSSGPGPENSGLDISAFTLVGSCAAEACEQNWLR
jgi:hypothetical protein